MSDVTARPSSGPSSGSARRARPAGFDLSTSIRNPQSEIRNAGRAQPAEADPVGRASPAGSSPAKVRANRANARKSTGPRTPEGKQRASLNATRHGLLAKDVLIYTDSLEAFEAHYREMLGALQPQGPMERMLAEKVVAQSWRLKRAVWMETCLIGHAVQEAETGDADILLTEEEFDSRAIQPFIGKEFAERLLCRHSPLDTLQRYERSIERSLNAALAQLRQSQAMRRMGRGTGDWGPGTGEHEANGEPGLGTGEQGPEAENPADAHDFARRSPDEIGTDPDLSRRSETKPDETKPTGDAGPGTGEQGPRTGDQGPGVEDPADAPDLSRRSPLGTKPDETKPRSEAQGSRQEGTATSQAGHGFTDQPIKQ